MKLADRVGLVVLLAWLAATACKREQRDGPERPEPVATRSVAPPDAKPPPSKPPPATAACDTLDRSECLRALHCTMHWISDGNYECRDSTGPCEENLMQSDRGKCESRDGCTWSPGECYCRFPGYGQTQVPDKDKNSGGACACGGGPPPLCKAE